MKRNQMKAFDTPKSPLKLKSIRVENGDGEELCVCPRCNGKGRAVASRQRAIEELVQAAEATICESCKGAGMVKVAHA